jgi:GNAT superfamily N-acetyltransferase
LAENAPAWLNSLVQRKTVSLEPRLITLRDGARAVTRPVGPQDGPSLARGLRRLSPQGNAYRFLHHRKRFTEQELHYLTHCDFVDHIGLVFVVLDAEGRERDGVGVARCIRTAEDPELAEVAIVFVDEWQRRGAGSILLGHLADLAWQAGIRRWLAVMHQENVAAGRLFSRFGDEVKRGRPGFGATEVTYALHGPVPPG